MLLVTMPKQNTFADAIPVSLVMDIIVKTLMNAKFAVDLSVIYVLRTQLVSTL